MGRDQDDEPRGPDGRSARWVQLAQQEIELRLNADRSENEEALDRDLQMQARVRARYPDIPVELAVEFSRRLSSGSFGWNGWVEAEEWLESTDWFQGDS